MKERHSFHRLSVIHSGEILSPVKNSSYATNGGNVRLRGLSVKALIHHTRFSHTTGRELVYDTIIHWSAQLSSRINGSDRTTESDSESGP